MLKGYDIDGVITKGIRPANDSVIITGRSYEEAPETYEMLRKLGIFNAVYFNPVVFNKKSRELAGDWKAKMINILGVEIFYEDSFLQADIIKKKTTCKLILIN